jgi:acyl carrier protein
MGVDMQEVASREHVKSLMAAVVAVHGHSMPDDESTDLRDIPFRSLDFSELALRVEDEIGRELNFDAPGLRSIRTVSDVLDLLDQLQAA